MAAILIFSVANGFFRNSIPICNSMQTFMLVSPNARFSSNIDLICPAMSGEGRGGGGGGFFDISTAECVVIKITCPCVLYPLTPHFI